MDLKTARIWQDVLLWGGALVSLVGAWGFQNNGRRTHRSYDDGRFAHRLGALLPLSQVRRTPCRGTPKRCPHCGAWVADEPEPEEKKKIQHKKKKH